MKEENIKIVTSVVCGFLSYLVGGFDSLSSFLLIMILLDVISGFMKGVYLKQLNSVKMFEGGLKKISIILVIFVTVQIDKTFLINFILRDIVIMFFIANEGLSFIENISHFIELPEKFIKFFKNLDEQEGEVKND